MTAIITGADNEGDDAEIKIVKGDGPPTPICTTHNLSSCSSKSIQSVKMVQSRLHYVPVFLFFFFPLSFTICYVVAVNQGHINFFFAFISDAGTLPPEQYVFAQLINMGAALFAYFVYIRYVQVDSFMRQRNPGADSTPIGNVVALAFGFTSSLGMSLVGNFPELKQKEVHLIGAFLAFVSGSVYIAFQGYLTFKMLPFFQSKAVAYIRTFLGILGVMLYFGANTTVVLAFQQTTNRKKLEDSGDALKWKPDDGGYTYRAASVIMEWLLVIIFVSFIVTFVSEFKKLKMEAPRVKFLIDIEEEIAQIAARSNESTFDVDDLTLSEVTESGDSRLPINGPFVLITEDPNESYPHISMPQSGSQLNLLLSNNKIR